MTTDALNGGAATADRDVLAIRALMAEDADRVQPEPSRATEEVESVRETSQTASSPQPLAGQSVLARVRPRHVALAAFALFTMVFPWLVLQVLAIFLAPIVAFAIYLAYVGVDGFWRRVRGSYLRIKARNPRVAERLQHAFLTGTAAWDGALDRLPIKVPEALYVPDFNAMAAEEAAHQHALDLRFAKLSEETGRDRW